MISLPEGKEPSIHPPEVAVRVKNRAVERLPD
jgi:hypothetical protein